MLRDKKGLSAIVMTVIMVALVLVAIGIVWAVVSNIIGEEVESVSVAAKCLEVSVGASSVDCSDPAACDVTLERTATGDEIAGVKFVFKNAANEASSVIDQAGNIAALATVTKTDVDSGITNVTSIDVTAYFIDESGSEQLCSQTDTFEFS